MAIMLRTVILSNFEGFLAPQINKGRLKLKIKGRNGITKTPVIEIDGVKDVEKTISAVENGRFVANSVRVADTPRGDISLSIRDWEIISISDDIFGNLGNSTGRLTLTKKTDDAFCLVGAIVASNHSYVLGVGE